MNITLQLDVKPEYIFEAVKNMNNEDRDAFIEELLAVTSPALLKMKEDPLQTAEKIHDIKLGSYRFRVGDYRVIFDIEDEDIIILRIGHRRDIYKR